MDKVTLINPAMVNDPYIFLRPSLPDVALLTRISPCAEPESWESIETLGLSKLAAQRQRRKTQMSVR